MKKKIIALLPFVIMPVFIPIYMVLDNLLLVEIFGCGCVPSTQTNILNMPFNANDLRLTVCSLLTIVLSIWSITLSKRFNQKNDGDIVYRCCYSVECIVDHVDSKNIYVGISSILN